MSKRPATWKIKASSEDESDQDMDYDFELQQLHSNRHRLHALADFIYGHDAYYTKKDQHIPIKALPSIIMLCLMYEDSLGHLPEDVPYMDMLADLEAETQGYTRYSRRLTNTRFPTFVPPGMI